ncbi:cytochrome c oxidase subunit 6A1, mitochondrial-like [Odontomachus brunneus]|uniref:cytochrome c oxidase subunit 6A1, mitochondrial-like n=1 Tax=Odontomachus brunneus TaxID=486640 RepID=UPI0013F1E588|nr:cytochrome c oxidase subunit 6A1, mitochondrial-like [Odontomachus brunneus]
MAAWARVVRTFTRKYSAAAGENQHATEQSMIMWKRLSFFVGFPCIGLAMLNSYLNHQAHHHDPRPEFIPYDHLRIRNKPFPWGDGNHSLFHNPKRNPLPDGYEE